MQKLFTKIQIKPNDLTLFEKAFTHKSIANELNVEHYNMLEFLGDSILQFYSSHYIYQNFPKITEGEATLLRSNNVNTKALGVIAKTLELTKYVRISRGAEAMLHNKKIQADLFESFVAAIYLDQGPLVTEQFLEKNLFLAIQKSYQNKSMSIKDPKTIFQEHVQHFSKKAIEYLIVKNADGRYLATLKHEQKIFGTGLGKSKKEAETNAAKDALKKLSLKIQPN